MIPKITELQERVAMELTRISTLKAIAVDKYNMEGMVKVISEKKRKKCTQREKKEIETNRVIIMMYKEQKGHSTRKDRNRCPLLSNKI